MFGLFSRKKKPVVDADAQVKALAEELAETIDEYNLLETELKAVKLALQAETADASAFAKEIAALDEAVMWLYDLAEDRLPNNDDRYDTLHRSLKRSIGKSGSSKASPRPAFA